MRCIAGAEVDVTTHRLVRLTLATLELLATSLYRYLFVCHSEAPESLNLGALLVMSDAEEVCSLNLWHLA
jgi:hypothetical protein